MLTIPFIKLENMVHTLDLTNLKDNKPKFIILHSTKLYPEFKDVLNYHKNKGWNGVGYHLFLSDSNKITQGRPFDKEGAHAWGFNTNSIGFCFYAPEGNIDKLKVKIGKGIIDNLKEEYNGLEVIPHTLAQVIYNNKLLKQFGIDKQFPETLDVIDEKLFQKVKFEMDYLVDKLDTDRYSHLKQSLKYFTNCPGALFYNFI